MKYYLDCEFNGYRGALMSLALVREDGRELYLVANHLPGLPEAVDWVRENVVPVIWPRGLRSPGTVAELSLEEFPKFIESFLVGDPLPTIIADWPDDIRYFCECMITGPGEMIDIPAGRENGDHDIQFVVSRVDAYPTDLPGAVQHNALWDARALRHKLKK